MIVPLPWTAEDDGAEFWQHIAANDPTHVSNRPSHPYVAGDGPHGLQTGRGGSGKPLNPAYVIALFALRAAADEVLIVTSRLDPAWAARSLIDDDPRLSLAEPDTAADTLRSLIERRTRVHLRPALVAVDESAATPELFALIEGLSAAMHAAQTYLMWGSTYPTRRDTVRVGKVGDQVLVDGIVSVVVELNGDGAVLRDARDVNGTDLFERRVQDLEVLTWQMRGDDVAATSTFIDKKVMLRPATQPRST